MRLSRDIEQGPAAVVPFARSGTCAIRRVLLASASGLAVAAFLATSPAEAACTVVGTGTIGSLNSNDQATCVGANSGVSIGNGAAGSTNLAVTIGDGSAPTTLSGQAGLPAIFFVDVSSSVITTTGQGGVTSDSNTIALQGLSSNNIITIDAGSVVSTSNSAAASIRIGNGTGNHAYVAGTVGQGVGIGVQLFGVADNWLHVKPGGVISGGSHGVVVNSSAGGASHNIVMNEGTISGEIGILVLNNGIVANSGTITGTGGTAIQFSAGDNVLALLAGGVINGNVLASGNSSLAFQGQSSSTFNLDLLGTGKQFQGFQYLEKYDAAVWTLTGTSAFNGPTIVYDGTLIVNGSLANSIATVQSASATLGGTGTLGGLVVTAGGTVAPGNSIGTLNIAGNVFFSASGNYQVEINGTGQSDKIAATGTASLNGGTVQIIPLGTGFKANTQYTILTAAGGVTGTFATLAPLDAPLVAGELQYDSNNVYFLLQQVQGFGTLLGSTPNQSAVAGALDAAQGGGGASAALTDAINTLAAKNSAGVLAGLDDLAGQSLADVHRFATLQGAGFHRLVTGAAGGWIGNVSRFSFGSGAGGTDLAPPMYLRGSARPSNDNALPVAGGYVGWAGAWGSWDRIDKTASTFGVNANSGGAAAGVELRGTDTTFGAAVGGSSGRLQSAGRSDSVESEMGHAALYARYRWAGLEFDAVGSVGYVRTDSSRMITFLGQSAEAESTAVTTGLSFGAARAFTFGDFSVTPFAGLDWYTARRGSFAETGVPGVNQIVSSSTDDILQGAAGLRLGYNAVFANGLPWAIATRFAIRHDFDGGAPTMRSSLEGAPGVQFTIAGADYARTAYIAGVQLDAALGASSTLRLGYDGEFSSDRVSQAVRGSLQYRF